MVPEHVFVHVRLQVSEKLGVVAQKIVDLIFRFAPVVVYFRYILAVTQGDNWHLALAHKPVLLNDDFFWSLEADRLRVPLKRLIVG